MVEHPCKGMTRPQRIAFERIATNLAPMASEGTIHALLRAGLIERGPDKFVGKDSFGRITRPDYFVPLPIHAQWCAWCSENVR